ncbi:2Fe-2S iron-sulfur cluster binding domain-containing protein [Rhodococcus pseudokoreensis]|uniref:2Fe-2S iron-sulfur cluster binding domain-containing protein n=1 Tax=Rhodococcus pseudokoreensis TaxID=2811421 RepID=A0A974W546_9NOCA|nr:2Fe-2S iron-sulfur cluster-binding protein [Rhodococcus pseudokoreensis]QSE90802.1 2Fe-2S iron-sulfur cluster binding domain-containing protein [Rhodococcus pseudokoreensis]
MSPVVNVTTREGNVLRLECREGDSLMEVLRDAEIDDELGTCGGCLSCASCHVWVDDADSDALPPSSEDEEDMLDSLDSRCPRSRLGCQVLLGGALQEITVSMPPSEF